MSRVKFYISLLLARLIYVAIRLLNKSSGTSFIGMVTLKFCPDFLTYCKGYIKNSAITVTGTNGKTTTSGLLAHILKNERHSVIHNVKGANMLTGVANMFALNVLPLNRFDYAVIESDEAYLTKLYDYFNSDYLLVTNLFRDQLDRYGELSTTASFIQSAIDKSSATLVLNADDPLVANFGKNRKAIYYGFEDVEFCSEEHDCSSSPSEIFNCICGEPLAYSKKFFAQEGHYYCANCGYKRPEPDFKGFAKIYKYYSDLKIEDVKNQKTYEFRVNLVGLYNAYNALGAISCALVNGVSPEIISSAVKSYKSIFGRAERKLINGHETLIQLIKNPAGASEVLETVDLDSNILIAINDNYADGRDISWLWDSDFEQLKDAKRLIVTSGIRAKDMALRLKYAGIPQEKIIIEENIERAVALVTKSDNIEERVTILPSYTALLKINKMKFHKKG